MTVEKPLLLIADDSKTNLKILTEILKGEFDIKIATNGREAVDRSQSAPYPELILLDIEMPELNGFEVCKMIKADQDLCEVPIIFITALNDKASVLKGFECGATDFISKPFEAEEVLARVRVHNQNIQLKHGLVQKAKEMEEFAYNAAHDLRAPLDLLDSYVDLIKHVDNFESEFLHKLSSVSTNLRNLITSLLSLAGVSNEEKNLLKLNLKSMVEEVSKELNTSIVEKGAIIEVANDIDFMCDLTQMSIIMRNLISNSLKYSREGVTPKITIKAEVGKEVQITVEDNGSGFGSEVGDELFKPFTRYHYNTQGHGLGLSICEKVIKNHQGTIVAKGEEGKGAKFELTLPLEPV